MLLLQYKFFWKQHFDILKENFDILKGIFEVFSCFLTAQGGGSLGKF